jgi:hypothetical protein
MHLTLACPGMRSTVMEIQYCEGVAYIQLAALRLVAHSPGVRVWED